MLVYALFRSVVCTIDIGDVNHQFRAKHPRNTRHLAIGQIFCLLTKLINKVSLPRISTIIAVINAVIINYINGHPKIAQQPQIFSQIRFYILLHIAYIKVDSHAWYCLKVLKQIIATDICDLISITVTKVFPTRRKIYVKSSDKHRNVFTIKICVCMFKTLYHDICISEILP